MLRSHPTLSYRQCDTKDQRILSVSGGSGLYTNW